MTAPQQQNKPKDQVVATYTEEQIAELQRKAALADRFGDLNVEELQRDKLKLESDAKARAESDKKNKISAYREKLTSFINEEAKRLNSTKFRNAVSPTAIGEAVTEAKNSLTDEFLSKLVEDTVDGEDRAKLKVKESLFNILTIKSKIVEEAIALAKQSDIMFALQNPPNLNTVSEDYRKLGNYGEMSYGSDGKRLGVGHTQREQVFNFILSKALKRPVVRENGSSIFDRYRPVLDDIVARQRWYESVMGKGENHWFSPGGAIHNILASEEMKNKISAMFKAEADEITTTVIAGGTSSTYLPLDASSAIIFAVWPRLIAMQLAGSSGIMIAPEKRIYERKYYYDDEDTGRVEKHFFGAVDSDNPATLETTFTLTTSGVVANDENALARASGHIPQDVYALVGEVVDADTTITVTCTDAQGVTTATASVTIYTTDAVGAIRKFTPTIPGNKFLDVTAVTSSGWTNAAAKGEVGIFTQEPFAGHTAGSAARKATWKLTRHTITEEDYDIQTNTPLSAIEDMQLAMAAGGGDSIDLIAQLISFLGDDLRNYIDQKSFDKIVQGASNSSTFLWNTSGEGYSDAKWRERIHFEMKLMSATVAAASGARPNWMVWNTLDEPYYSDALTESNISKLAPEANDAFSDGSAQFTVAGNKTWISENLGIENVIMGSNNARTGFHAYTYVPFKLLQALNPSAGMETVVMMHHRAYYGVVNGRSLGKLRISRR